MSKSPGAIEPLAAIPMAITSTGYATTWLSSWRADACPTSAVLNSRLKMCGRVRRQVQAALTKRGAGDIARLSSLTAFTPMRCVLLSRPAQCRKGSLPRALALMRPFLALSPRHFPVRASRRTLARDGHRLLARAAGNGRLPASWDHVLGLAKIPCPGIVRKHVILKAIGRECETNLSYTEDPRLRSPVFLTCWNITQSVFPMRPQF